MGNGVEVRELGGLKEREDIRREENAEESEGEQRSAEEMTGGES